MSRETNSLALNWYAIHTKPREEARAGSNLQGWRVETFMPLIRERRYHPFTGKPLHVVKPLFSRYIFARFSPEMSSKIRYTRGVQTIVGYGDEPTLIDDEIIQVIKARMEDGYVKIEDRFEAGDAVRIKDGPLKNFIGVFVRQTNNAYRVMVLLDTINYQANVVVHRDLLSRVDHLAYSH
jgi:transcriptional antiterminator RfaH